MTAPGKHMSLVFPTSRPAPGAMHRSIFAETAKPGASLTGLRARPGQIAVGAACIRIASLADGYLRAFLHAAAGTGTRLLRNRLMRDVRNARFSGRMHRFDFDRARFAHPLKRLRRAAVLAIEDQCFEPIVGMLPPMGQQTPGQRT